jgi:putative sterol carrier protein
MVRKLWIGTSLPKEKIDFTVSSSYKIAKQIFLGELNPATAFINGQFKVEPLSKVYLRPRFSAKSVVTGNFMLKIARQVPTRFVPDNGDKGGDAY